jgi:hypothetical protein
VGSARMKSLSVLAAYGMLAIMAACVHSAPKVYGAYRDLAPKVAATKGERLPVHVTVDLAKSANVAVFLVVPGGTTRLLFPADSMQSDYVESGAHLVETSLAHQALSDSSRLARRPTNTARVPTQTQMGRNGRAGTARDSTPNFAFNQHGYLMIYASAQPLAYSMLATRVAGLSVPISDNDALITVTKLVREATHTTGAWAAYATDFPP